MCNILPKIIKIQYCLSYS